VSSEHAILAPSSAPVWGYCSGSVQAQADAPDYETPEQAAGTAAHWVCSEVLLSLVDRTRQPELASDYVGRTALNGVMVTAEMCEAAHVYIHDVLQVAQEHGALQGLLIEHRVHMPAIHQQNWGTLDCALPLLDKGVIYLWDFKFGHRECKAEENLQLIDYVAGLVNELKINGYAEQHTDVVMRIVQPRCYHADGPISEWRVKLSTLRGWWNHLEHAANMAMTNPRLTTGKHCRDCVAVGRCPAARKAAYSLIDYIDQPYDVDTLDGASLATEWRMLSDGLAAARARHEALEEDLRHRVSQGDTTTGLALKTTEGRLDWSVPVPQAIALAQQFGVDARKEAALTPTQTIAAAPAVIRPALQATLASVTKRPTSTSKLIPAADSKIAAVFKKPQ
jgi:hypothetical protein